VDVLGSKMHYVEEGVGDPILFLHGQPTSSYLWRNVIPHLSPLGRCVAPDLIGFGKSDKPDIEYRFFDHVRYIDAFIESLELQNITLVVHDWGAGIGFNHAMRHEGNIKGLAFMEPVFAPIPSWDDFPEALREVFRGFRTPDVGWDLLVNQNVFVEQILPAAILRKLTDEEMDTYREPFLDVTSRKPVWRWPNELPLAGEPADVVAAVSEFNAWLQQTKLPKILFHAQPGAIMPPAMVEWCRAHLSNLATVDVGEGIHYLQEDNPHAIGAGLAEWYRRLD
jgi:haloalkane dehalogenase